MAPLEKAFRGLPQRPNLEALTPQEREIVQRLNRAGFAPLVRPWQPVGSVVRWTTNDRDGVPIYAATLKELFGKVTRLVTKARQDAARAAIRIASAPETDDSRERRTSS
jgi:hypothetical protein